MSDSHHRASTRFAGFPYDVSAAIPGTMVLDDGRVVVLAEEFPPPEFERRVRVSVTDASGEERWVRVDAAPGQISTHQLRGGVHAVVDDGDTVVLKRNGPRPCISQRLVMVSGAGINWVCRGRHFRLFVIDCATGEWVCRVGLQWEISHRLDNLGVALVAALILHRVPLSISLRSIQV